MQVAKTRHARVYRDITLPSLSVPCLLIGKYTEEGLPRSLSPLFCHLLRTAEITVVEFMYSPLQDYIQIYIVLIFLTYTNFHITIISTGRTILYILTLLMFIIHSQLHKTLRKVTNIIYKFGFWLYAYLIFFFFFFFFLFSRDHVCMIASPEYVTGGNT